MLDYNGIRLDTVLLDKMFEPSLLRHLFSVTKFGNRGHMDAMH
jgi:hypothetical protein